MARGWDHPKACSSAGLSADAGGQTGPHGAEGGRLHVASALGCMLSWMTSGF